MIEKEFVFELKRSDERLMEEPDRTFSEKSIDAFLTTFKMLFIEELKEHLEETGRPITNAMIKIKLEMSD